MAAFGPAVIKELLKAVASYLEDEIKWGSNIKISLRKLQAALSPIQVALERAEEVELDLDQKPRMQEWMWKLRDAVEGAEDALDEMEYLKRDAEEKLLAPVAATSSGFRSASLFQYSCIRAGKKDLLLDKTLDKLTTAVQSLKQVSDKLSILYDVINTSPSRGEGGGSGRGGVSSSNNRSRDTGHVLTVDVFGREEDKRKVLKWLTNAGRDGRESRSVSALTIYGLGGLGKTTLARFVYDDCSLDFEVKMWVGVSNNNDEMAVLMQKAIASATGYPPKTDVISQLQVKMKEIVKSKKCLLVLDDVWEGQENQNQRQWDNFIGVLLAHARRGSKILVTSRIKYEGFPIKSDSLPLSCLNEDESLALFYRHAFDGVDPSGFQNLKLVGNTIVNKCGGLPLALKIMGGLLSNELNIDYWLLVAEKDILDSDAKMIDVKKVLKLSYQWLPSELQSCFRICSLFPQCYEFRREELVTLWTGLGCINQRKDEDTQPEDFGREYLDDLVRRSFFVYDRDGDFYTMHDLLHDLACNVSTGECLRIKGNKSEMLPTTLCHLFVDQLNSNLICQISNLKRLRTLGLNYNYSEYNLHDLADFGEIDDILSPLMSLHSLFISSTTMPNLSVIGQLKHLRQFHLKVENLNQSLEPLYKLYQLLDLQCEETDSKHNAHDRFVCDGISNLLKLRHFVLPDRLFGQITQLRHLIDLQKVELNLKKDNLLKLSYMKDLNELCHICITNERERTSIEEAKEANFVKKKKLETLSLNWIECDPGHHEEIYDCLHPGEESKIKHLDVINYSGVRAPKWMTNDILPCLTHLKLCECKNLKHLPPLGQLPSLKVLILEVIAGVKQSGTEFFGGDDIGGFPSLEELRIKKMVQWEEWTGSENIKWFPCLKKLYIKSCQRLKALPALPFSLKELHLDSVGLAVVPPWQEVITSHRNTPLLEDLMIRDCQELIDLYPLLCCCVSLKELFILRCHSLQKLPDLPFSLKRLEIGYAGLIALPAWNNVNEHEVSPSLEHLRIYSCEELIYVQPFMRKCAFLKVLFIQYSPNILTSDAFNLNRATSSTCLDLIDGLTSLTTLSLSNMTNMRTLNCAKALSLEILRIYQCPYLILLDGFQALTRLTDLTIRDCYSLNASSSAAAIGPLIQTHSPCDLDIDNILLLQIEPLRSMNSVQRLTLIDGEDVTCFPHQWLLQNHSSLTRLDILHFPLLESLPDEMPSSLNILRIWDCHLLKLLPNKLPSSLKALKIRDCPLLKVRYKKGGPLWHTIAHIPKVSFKE